MKLGIVGSRRRDSKDDWTLLYNRIAELDPSMLISGGCPLGADRFAEEIARVLGIPITIYYPNLPKGWAHTKQESREAMYARNKQIARNSDHLIALVAPDRKGGTENTIKYFQEDRPTTWEVSLEIL